MLQFHLVLIYCMVQLVTIFKLSAFFLLYIQRPKTCEDLMLHTAGGLLHLHPVQSAAQILLVWDPDLTRFDLPSSTL